MTAERLVIPGISSRRSACDRCRALKLRCLRDGPTHEPCYRCSRTEVACATSPTYRIRDHFKLRTRAPTVTVPHESRASSSPVLRLSIESSPSTVLSTGPGASQVATSDPELWHNNLQWQLSDLPACTGETLEAATPISSSFSASTFDLAWSNTTSLDEGPPLPLSKQISSSSIESDRGGLLGNLGWDLGERVPSSCFASWSGRNTGTPEQFNADETSFVDLSRANMALATQWNRIRDPALTLTLDMLVTPLAETHTSQPGGMLTATNDFLHVLRSLARRHRLQAASKSHIGTTIPGSHSAHAQTPQPNMSGQDASQVLDSTTALLILSSYIHLLRIYTVQFETLCGLLQDVADSSFPSLDPAYEKSILSGKASTCTKRCLYSTDEMAHLIRLAQPGGHLQATLFIQMATNLFEQVEKLLGLPSEFRIDHDSRNGGGILSGEDFGSIVASVVEKEALSTTGGIHTLRHSVKRARELLRDHILP